MLIWLPDFRPIKKKGGTAAGLPRPAGEVQPSPPNGATKDQVRVSIYHVSQNSRMLSISPEGSVYHSTLFFCHG